MLCNFRSSCLTNTRVDNEEANFVKNGSLLHEKLLAFTNGKYSPMRRFSSKEILEATNNFSLSRLKQRDSYYELYEGSLGGSHLVSIKRYVTMSTFEGAKEQAIRDMVINSQMNKHKNVLKLLGCCLDFQLPVAVYEYAGTLLLSHCVEGMASGADPDFISRIFSWKSRLMLANQIANAIVYLHTALPTFVVHRDLKPSGIVVDHQLGVAKLFDFSLSISIPAGKTKVEDDVMGTLTYLDPEYGKSSYVTTKSDTYSFGTCLLNILTGQRTIRPNDEQVINCVESHQLNEIVDPRVLWEVAGTEDEQQLQPFAALALRCTQANGEDRPDMIDVAKELRKIDKSGSLCLAPP